MHVEDRHGLDELRCLARGEQNARMRIRLQAVVLATQGRTFQEIAQTLGTCSRSVQNWVHRYNHHGAEGLQHRAGQGRHEKLTPQDREGLCARIEAGPCEKDSVCTLRGKDIQRILQEEFGKLYHLNGVYSLLHRLGYSSLMPRPKHRHGDPEAQETFKKNSPRGWKKFAPHTPTNKSRSGSKTKRASGNKVR
jgi:transposase